MQGHPRKEDRCSNLGHIAYGGRFSTQTFASNFGPRIVAWDKGHFPTQVDEFSNLDFLTMTNR